jgi:glutaminyl-tRNA synthetase
VDLMLYDHLFTIENTNDIPEGQTYDDYLNPDSLQKLSCAKVEACAFDAAPGERFQFVRVGYFVKDTKYEGTFNRIVTLKGSYKA